MRIALFAGSRSIRFSWSEGRKKYPTSADQRLDCPHGVVGDAQVAAG